MADAMPPLHGQVCWEHLWEKAAGKNKEGRMRLNPSACKTATCLLLAPVQTRKRLCLCSENEVAEGHTFYAIASCMALCEHGAVVYVGGMAPCRESCCSGLSGFARGVVWAVGQA